MFSHYWKAIKRKTSFTGSGRKKLVQFRPGISKVFTLSLTFYNAAIKLPIEVYLKSSLGQILIWLLVFGPYSQASK